ncbi:MAG: shikimate dehydrogenase [Alphaproteobacteria bacterium]|nr:MAG: shikimate dehydrogenase [Alphaproteobacteria bacterium]
MGGKTKSRLAGVIGWPIAHSLSPHLHRFWLKRAGLEGDYVPLAVRPSALAEALAALPALGFRGVNVTVPHKEAAARLVDRLEPDAARLGAVNLIRVDSRGRLVGSNTDGRGFLASLERAVPDWKERAAAGALLLGAGGAARAVLGALLGAGVRRIHIANRTAQRAQRLAALFEDERIVAAGWSDRSALLKEVGLLVNTTTLGMEGQPPLELELSLLGKGSVVVDLVYRPLCTGLLREAGRRGHAAVDGLGMLVHQAVPAFEAFYGQAPVVDAATFAHLTEALEKP